VLAAIGLGLGGDMTPAVYRSFIAGEYRARQTDETRVDPVGVVVLGPRELAVDVSDSTLHEGAVRLTARAPRPTDPERKRLEQTFFVYGPKLDELIALLEQARNRLHGRHLTQPKETGK
jgi:hypothetical protein